MGSTMNRRHHATILRLVRAAQAEGWEVTKTRGGHWKFKAPNGDVIFTGSTPSDKRAWLNVRAHLRRHGLAV